MRIRKKFTTADIKISIEPEFPYLSVNTVYDNLSLRGRVAYAIMCFERYAVQKYPDKDMSEVAELMWKIIDDSDYIDNSAYHYLEIIPEYLFEAEDFISSQFDYLTEQEYNHFKALLPKPEDDTDLDTIMHKIYEIAMEYAYTVVELDRPETAEYLQEVSNILKKNSIELPNIADIPKYEWDDTHGWGQCFNGRHLSIILN